MEESKVRNSEISNLEKYAAEQRSISHAIEKVPEFEKPNQLTGTFGDTSKIKIDQRFLDEHDQLESSNNFKEKTQKKKGGPLRGLTSIFKSNPRKKAQIDDGDTINLQDSVIPGSMIVGKKHSPLPSIDAVSAINPKTIQKSNSDIDQNLADFLGNEENYLEVDMGEIDQEELPFMIIDKDTGRVYDTRNDKHVERLSNIGTASFKQNDDASMGMKTNGQQSAWGDWWRMKKKNDQEYLAAAELGDLAKLKRFIDKQTMQDMVADVNAKGLDQWSALHFAADNGHLEIIQEIIKQPDIEIDATSSIQRTPLHMAAIKGHSDIGRELIKNGADPNSKDFDQSTPLHCASEFGQTKFIIFMLKEAKADPSIKNKFGYQPSDIAQNLDTRKAFEEIEMQGSAHSSQQPQNNQSNQKYGRTEYNGVLMRNDRISGVQRLLNKQQSIQKLMEEKPKQGPAQPGNKQPPVATSRWKQKFIKIRDQKEMHVDGWEEEDVGPNDFRIISKLGQGSFGQVYVVEKINQMPDGTSVNTGNLYAMKILNKKQIMGQNLVKYAKTERDVLTYMSHPFIVGMKYSFQTPEKLFLLLDYAAGGNMSRALHKDRRFTEERGRMYLAEIILALEDLHKKDIIYRDLKPDNIVFDSAGHALVTDFGLSKENVTDDSCAKSFCGSPAYLAPEMLKRSGHGKSTDWYLLGVLLYEMLVGIPPYYSNNKEQLYENIQRGPLKLPNFLSEEARALLIALMNRNPHKRLGAGPNGAAAIKAHPFFKNLDWVAAENRQLPVPLPAMKKITEQEIPLEKVYGRGAFDEGLKDHNRLQQWSFVRKPGATYIE